jgi:Pretoxin HINT domain/Bacterial CdiA-CT RNAse A domain
MVQDSQAEVTKTLDEFDIALDFDKAFIKAIWDGFTGDFVRCSHGSVTGCLWAASWFIPESKIVDAVNAIKSLNLAMHTGIGIADAWKVIDGLKLSPEIADAIHAEVDVDEAALAGCEINSFLPGTQVLRADGSYLAASAVHVGDQVLGVDPVTGKKFASTVTATYAHATDRALRTLTLTGGDRLTTTPGHRVYVSGKGWEFAADLRVGDRVGTSDGAGRVITAIGSAPGAGRRVLDFTVAGTHDFYVRAGAADVLVHNCTDLTKDDGIAGAHVLGDHVNITPADAVAKATSSVPNGVWGSQALAQQAVDRAVADYIKKYPRGLQDWFAKYGKNPGSQNELKELPIGSFPKGTSLGKVYYANGTVANAGNTFKVVLKRVPGHPQGFVVYTAYPLP